MAGQSGKEMKNAVGPVLRAGEMADAMIQALEEDNPGKQFNVQDHIAYVRIETEGECIVRRETLERALGRAVQMPEIEVSLTSFAGRIETNDDYMRFYLEKKL
jgi:toluene monooxygenase system protein D